MCKSELNACFTKVLDPLNANSPLTHGCLDPIANAADVCSGSTGGSSSSSSRRSDVLAAALAATLDCCHEDMCNYRGLQDLAHTRESAGRGRRSGTTGCSDIYASVKVQNSTLSYWLAPRGRNLWFLLDKRSIFLFPIPKKQYVALLFMDIELTNAPPSFFYIPSSHSFHFAINWLRPWAWEVGSLLVYLEHLEGDQMSPVLLFCVHCVISL